MQKYGFVYVWMDKKKGRFYVGSHWGTESDGYVCSSRWMRNTYKRRKEDFKRRIVYRTEDRSILLEEEGRWLQMIKKEELGKRYYNLNATIKPGHWSSDERSRMTVGQKLSLAKVNMTSKAKNEWKKKLKVLNTGKTLSDSAREKCRVARSKQVITLEHRAKISASNKGKTYSDETREKISIAGRGRKHSVETKKKMSDSQKLVTKKPLSTDTKAKISMFMTGKSFITDAGRKRISDHWKGRKREPMSEKTKAKLRMAAIKQHSRNVS